jgi:hypothetical protein
LHRLLFPKEAAMTRKPTPPSHRDDGKGDFPAGLGGGEPRTPADHRVGETTRQDPRVTDVDPAPQRPGSTGGGGKPANEDVA